MRRVRLKVTGKIEDLVKLMDHVLESNPDIMAVDLGRILLEMKKVNHPLVEGIDVDEQVIYEH